MQVSIRGMVSLETPRAWVRKRAEEAEAAETGRFPPPCAPLGLLLILGFPSIQLAAQKALSPQQRLSGCGLRTQVDALGY